MVISEKLAQISAELTRSEQQLANVLQDDYPIAGICSITEFAAKADVSTPTVGRMVQKLGLSGYAEFQSLLRKEMAEMLSNPTGRAGLRENAFPDEYILNRFATKAIENLNKTIEALTPEKFEQMCKTLGDPNRKVFIAAGRITNPIAQYLYLGLQMVRSNVRLLPMGGAWPHEILEITSGDTLVVFDVRRYENTTLQVAQICHEKGAEILLLTDQWGSPIQKIAKHVFSGRVDIPGSRDSSLALYLLVECLLAAIQEDQWPKVKLRLDELEAAFDRTKLFRKFS